MYQNQLSLFLYFLFLGDRLFEFRRAYSI